jgi:hypothetical protein
MQGLVRRSMMVIFATVLIALSFNPEPQESPAQKTNIRDEELKMVT